MNNLTFLIILDAIIIGINCIISIILYAVNRTYIFKLMLTFWIAITLQFIAFGIIQTFTTKIVIEAIIANGLILLWINSVMLKMLYHITALYYSFKKYLIVTIGGIILAGIAAVLGYEFTVVSSISIFIICFSTMYVILKLVSQIKRKSTLLMTYIIFYLIALVHLMDYPFLRLIDWFAPYGFTIHTAIHVALGVLLPSYLIQEQMMSFNRELRRSEEKFRSLVESSSDVIWEINTKGEYTYISPQVETILGYRPEELIGISPFSLMHPGESGVIESLFLKLLKGRTAFSNIETTVLHKKGHKVILETSGVAIMDASGEVTGYRGIDRDVTEKKQIQEQLNHSQKMDAIGQLAGGVAHDFNNMLTGIMGLAELLKSPQRNLDWKGHQYIDLLIQAVNRASDLTKKLLAFGRKGRLSSTAVDVHSIIDDTIAILKRTIDRKIKIIFNKDAQSAVVIGDNSALQNSIMNLGINASHAMADGGTLTITTGNIEFSRSECDSSHFDIYPGQYIEIVISDTGAGIPPGDLARIFEPFYTTKKQGEGTGLGLSAVYGTIQDHHGAIAVNSELGKGTVFRLYLPCSDTVPEMRSVESAILPGKGSILLADDEEIIRITGKAMLQEMGYEVLLAENGKKAVDIFRDNRSVIDLVILDMIMPEMNGREAFYEIKRIDDNSKIIIASGFPGDESLNELKKAGLSGFIHKPFRNSELSRLLTDVLKME